MTALLKAAEAFAWAAHAGQQRKYDFNPYICHPAHVVGLLVSAGISDEEVLAAAWLHDAVEDNSNVTNLMIRTLFGTRVAELVEALTNVEKEVGNRKHRKELDRRRMAGASADAKSIRLADMLSNIPSIILNDLGFAKVYLQEKSELLEVLKDGNASLYNAAHDVISEYFARYGRNDAA